MTIYHAILNELPHKLEQYAAQRAKSLDAIRELADKLKLAMGMDRPAVTMAREPGRQAVHDFSVPLDPAGWEFDDRGQLVFFVGITFPLGKSAPEPEVTIWQRVLMEAESDGEHEVMKFRRISDEYEKPYPVEGFARELSLRIDTWFRHLKTSDFVKIGRGAVLI